MKKRIILLVVIALLMALTSFAFALEAQAKGGQAAGTLTSAQVEKGILSTLGKDIENTQGNGLLTDEDKIKTIVTDVFLAMNNCEKEDINFEFASVFNRNSDNAKKSYEYRKNKIKYINELRKRGGEQILWDNICVDFKDIDINGNDSTLKLIEDKKYVAGKQDNGISESQISYTIKLVKAEGKWLIDSITSEDEFDKDYQDKGLSVEQMLGEHDKLAKVEVTPSSGQLSAQWVSSYNRSLASSYAYTYALSYNGLFKSFSSDCQNFGSQCAWYGFGGSNNATAINNKYRPMVNTPADTWEQWWQNGPNGSYDPYYHWIRVIDFRNWVIDYYKNYGIFGSSTQGSVANAEPGDIVQIKDSSGVWYHTYVVYSVNGTYGSRTPSNIWICAHTTNRRNVQLSTLGIALADMRLVKINSIQCP